MSRDEFVRETRSSLRRLTNGLIELEREGGDGERLDELFRTAHTLKGNCDMAGVEGASRLAHALEDVLSDLRDGSTTSTPDLIDASLAAVDDMDAMLQEWREHGSTSTEPEPSASRLREEVRRHRNEPDAARERGDSRRDGSEPSEPGSAPPGDDLDPTVVDALESASDFDDLDRLMAEMDDPVERDDDSGGWGTFDGDDSAVAADERQRASDEAPGESDVGAGPTDAPPETMDEFDAIKRDVETDDISDLDAELVDVEFGEFDDDDELSIQDLVEGELSDAAPPDEGSAPSGGPTDAAASADPSGAPEPTVRDDDIGPEDFGLGPSDAETADPDDSTAVDAHSVRSFEEADPVDPAGTDAGAAGEESIRPSDVFDLADDPSGDSSGDGTEPGPDGTVDDPGVGSPDIEFPDEQTFDPGGRDPAVPEESALEFTQEFPDEFDDDVSDVLAGGGDPRDTTGDAELTGELGGADADRSDGLDEGTDVSEKSDEETGVSEKSDEEADRSDELDDDRPVGQSAGTGPDLASEVPDPSTDGVSDVDLPDVEELTGTAVDAPGGDEPTPEFSFARDEHTVEFESRFADRFGDDGEDDVVPLVQSASATIEESSLDPAMYQSGGAVETPLEHAGAHRSDQIQSITVDVQNADTLLNLVEELSLAQLRLERSDEADRDDHLSQIASVTSELRRTVMDLRLMPVSTVVDGLPRVVRDVARQQDKRVAFEVRDEGVELDRSIIEKLGDPLVHIVRNAVDHGIERPEERERKGKPPEGTVELRARRDRERVVIEVEDDGRGLSADRIRQQAVDRGVASEEQIERMALDEVYDLVFEPGFSTADEVTDVSGRGVGMDAVKRTVNSLDGTVTVDSEPDAGTTVQIRLPVSVAVSKMLFVGAGSEEYAIPADVVDDVRLLGADEDPLTDDGRVAVEWPDEGPDRPDHVPVLNLTEAFDVPDGEGGEARSVGRGADGERALVRLDPDARELALLCDGVGDAREVVVKPYEKLLGGVPGISGATVNGDGSLVNIIDVTTL